jgi:hypothetical protein
MSTPEGSAKGGSKASDERRGGLRGSPAQVEWAERIKLQVNEEFDRVVRSFKAVATTQSEARRADTEAILAILEDKRADVMGQEDAGYFIHHWQDMGDQVRQMILRDSEYKEIRARMLKGR